MYKAGLHDLTLLGQHQRSHDFSLGANKLFSNALNPKQKTLLPWGWLYES